MMQLQSHREFYKNIWLITNTPFLTLFKALLIKWLHTLNPFMPLHLIVLSKILQVHLHIIEALQLPNGNSNCRNKKYKKTYKTKKSSSRWATILSSLHKMQDPPAVRVSHWNPLCADHFHNSLIYINRNTTDRCI